MAEMVREAHGGRRGRTVVVGGADPPRHRRPARPVPAGRATANCWRSPKSWDATVPARWPSCRRARSAGSTTTDKDLLIYLGQSQRPAGDHPGPGRPQQGRRPDGDVGGVEGVPRPRQPRRGAGVYSLLITRPFDRAVRGGRDEPALPRRAAAGTACSTLPAGRAPRPAAATPSPGPNCATPSRTTTAIRPRERPFRRRCGATSTSTRSPSRDNQKWASRSIADIADEHGVTPADAVLDLALDEDFAVRLRWRTESPEWAAAVGEAQLDPRMLIGTSDGGAHLARDDGADWSSYFLRQLGTRSAGLDARGGHPPDHGGPGSPGRPRRSRHADAGRLGRHDDLRSRRDRPDAQGVRARPARAGSAATKPLAAGFRRRSSTACRSSSTASSPASCPVTSCGRVVPPAVSQTFWGGSPPARRRALSLPVLFDERGTALTFGRAA